MTGSERAKRRDRCRCVDFANPRRCEDRDHRSRCDGRDVHRRTHAFGHSGRADRDLRTGFDACGRHARPIRRLGDAVGGRCKHSRCRTHLSQTTGCPGGPAGCGATASPGIIAHLDRGRSLDPNYGIPCGGRGLLHSRDAEHSGGHRRGHDRHLGRCRDLCASRWGCSTIIERDRSGSPGGGTPAGCRHCDLRKRACLCLRLHGGAGGGRNRSRPRSCPCARTGAPDGRGRGAVGPGQRC